MTLICVEQLLRKSVRFFNCFAPSFVTLPWIGSIIFAAIMEATSEMMMKIEMKVKVEIEMKMEMKMKMEMEMKIEMEMEMTWQVRLLLLPPPCSTSRSKALLNAPFFPENGISAIIASF